MPLRNGFVWLMAWLTLWPAFVFAQRIYKSSSVLASGNWAKMATTTPGIYKADAAFVAGLGIPVPAASNSIRLFGAATTAPMPEAVNPFLVDDLEELAIEMVDGGDGSFSGADYILFYSPGPHTWRRDSVSGNFLYQHHLYSNQAFYFITTGGVGKRIGTATIPGSPPVQTVNSFDEHWAYENDSINFLNSGKDWFGEELSNLPGRTLTRNFSFPASAAGATITLDAAVAARSLGSGSRFTFGAGSGTAGFNVGAVGIGPFDAFAQKGGGRFQLNNNTAVSSLSVSFAPGSGNAQGWIDRLLLFYKRPLVLPQGGQLLFRDVSSAGSASIQFNLGGATAAVVVWNITDALTPQRVAANTSGTTLSFVTDASTLKEYAAANVFLTPQAVGRVQNQNLHNSAERDYFIVTHPTFLPAAQKLAQFHQTRSGLRPIIVTTEQVFNEFSGGVPDPAAIRNYLKLHYDRYRNTWNNSGKYLLLLGKGSFDPKNRIRNNTALVPVWESPNSLDPLATHTSDDFFGFLDDGEDINGTGINLLDIGIGRVPAKTAEEVASFADKVQSYFAPSTFGPWRTEANVVADDEDNNLHVQDAELMASTIKSSAPFMQLQKIYLDAFKQEGTSTGGRYPAAVAAINNHIFNRTLIWNYSGHGGPGRLAEEGVLEPAMADAWLNSDKLPLFIAATCDFAPYDNPLQAALGENLVLRPRTGGIGILTSSRVVFAFSNRIINNNYLQSAFTPGGAFGYLTLGASVQKAKNITYQSGSDVVNNRKFALIGDPALRLHFPQSRVRVTEINGQPVGGADTLRAGSVIAVSAVVTDSLNNTLTNFNGTGFLTVYDKPQTLTTLGNDAASPPTSFQNQNTVLFKGKATVTNGRFQVSFRLPRDMSFAPGRGRFSLYAHNNVLDGSGYSDSVLMGGASGISTNDGTGPKINAWLNDETFVNGGITGPNPVLLLRLTDSSGINSGGVGIDKDIVATLDGNNQQFYVLNAFYEADVDSYQQGRIRFAFTHLKPGPHTLKIKAWDVLNNSNETELQFTVVNNEALQLTRVYNYPNPFTTKTAFWFDHNQPGSNLRVQVQVFTVSGKIVRTLRQTINNSSTRSTDVEWDGRDDFGGKLGHGVYLYRLSVYTPDGKSKSVLQRLVIL